MNKKSFKTVLASALTSGLLLTACGGGDLTTPQLTPPPVAQNTSARDAQLAEALPQIIQGLEAIKDSLDNLSISPVSSGGTSSKRITATKPRSSTSTKKTSTKTTSTPKASTSTRTVKKSTATKKSTLPDANAEMAKIMKKLSSAPFIKATIEKTEKGLTTGKTKLTGLVFLTKQPNVVKIDVVKSSSSPAGTKATYTSGVGKQLKVRPAGALSFVTTSIDKNDDRIVSDNGFTMDDLDFFGVTRRFAEGYTAKLVGKTKVAGKTVNVLRIASKGTNSLLADIKYEHIGYEPDTHTIRLWEMYAGEATPFFRLTLTSIEFPSAIPASEFKI